MRVRLVLVAILVASSGCGSASSDEKPVASVPSSVAATSTPTTVPSTTAPSLPAAKPYEVETARDLVYQESRPGLHKPLVDVYAPTTEGPWPVVITYHAHPLYNTKANTSSLARYLAEQGAVVFNPTWGGTAVDNEYLRGVLEGPCAYWYAVEHAAEYGGNPDDVTVVGFSGGGFVLGVEAMHSEDQAESPGCAAPSNPVDFSSLVLFEGDHLLAPWWDDNLRDDPTLYRDITVWDYIDGYAGYPIHFLLDEQTAQDHKTYSVEALLGPGTSTVDDYLELRDPQGDLRETLEQIGAFDDGQLNLTEFSLLFHEKLIEAGHPSTVTWIDAASHSISTEAKEAIAEIIFGEPGA